MKPGYAVVFRIMNPYGQEFRLPDVTTFGIAEDLAEALRDAYPGALIEIAHKGLRTLI